MNHGDTFEHNDHKFRVTFRLDDDTTPPWKREDGHGPVSDWTRRTKAPGEMVLCADRGSHRYYNFAEAVRIARRDGWDAEPYSATETRGQRARKAAMADFERLRRWCADQWSYIGVLVHLLDDEGDNTNEFESVWSVESDAGEYLTELARDLADEIIHRLAIERSAA